MSSRKTLLNMKMYYSWSAQGIFRYTGVHRLHEKYGAKGKRF